MKVGGIIMKNAKTMFEKLGYEYNNYCNEELRKKITNLEYKNERLEEENKRLNNIINRTIKYVESLSSSGRGCDIYEDIKKEILNQLKGDNK